jgi:hypothetical protein
MKSSRNCWILEAMSVQQVEPSRRESSEKLSLWSIWQDSVDGPISDELLEWPPDLFALTEAILERSETHRLLLHPPVGAQWPPARIAGWPAAVEEAGRAWSAWVEDANRPMPQLLSEEWQAFRERAEDPLEPLVDGDDWRMCEALITLHAIADEACAGLGLALDRADAQGCIYRARGRELLARTGSLARIPTRVLRVLPKALTSASGTSARSLSRYACMLGPRIDIRWYKFPARRRGTGPEAEAVNLLLLPWPLRVRESDFRPLEGSVRGQDGELAGLFEFAPSEKLDLDLLDRVLLAARDEVGSVDVVVLPESAVDESEVADLEALLDEHGVGFVNVGVRGHPTQPGCLPQNWIHSGISPRLEKGGRDPQAAGEQWFHIRQHKLNRWSLDEGQINQYNLGGVLHPHIRWWEGIDVPPRLVQVVELGEGITVVFLVCEDLAQSDGLADVLRAVAPTFVMAVLLDGPQLASRWAARYASVLADDPGSAVSTLTSFGMTERSRPHGRDASRAIALWKDPGRGLREMPLEPGAQGVLLTMSLDRTKRRSADGRTPIANATEAIPGSVYQIRADGARAARRSAAPHAPHAPELNVDDLTVLTGWAEALAEILAFAPERAEAVLAEAHADAPWRAAFGIAAPSRSLSQAMESLARRVRGDVPDTAVTFDAVLSSSRADRPGENSLDRLARRALQSALEQRRTRQAGESMGA